MNNFHFYNFFFIFFFNFIEFIHLALSSSDILNQFNLQKFFLAIRVKNSETISKQLFKKVLNLYLY